MGSNSAIEWTDATWLSARSVVERVDLIPDEKPLRDDRFGKWDGLPRASFARELHNEFHLFFFYVRVWNHSATKALCALATQADKLLFFVSWVRALSRYVGHSSCKCLAKPADQWEIRHHHSQNREYRSPVLPANVYCSLSIDDPSYVSALYFREQVYRVGWFISSGLLSLVFRLAAGLICGIYLMRGHTEIIGGFNGN